MMEVHDSTPASTDAQPDDEASDGYERPSKTQRKKEMHALQALGQQLVDLGRRTAAPLPPAQATPATP